MKNKHNTSKSRVREIKNS